MREESNRHESELSDAALSGVSGGETYEDLRQHRTDKVVGRRMNFLSDVLANFAGLLVASQEICKCRWRKRHCLTRRRSVRCCLNPIHEELLQRLPESAHLQCLRGGDGRIPEDKAHPPLSVYRLPLLESLLVEREAAQMREEIRNPGTELGDAALSGVSGAGGSNQTGGECFTQATRICEICNASGKHCSGKRLDSLIAYLKEHGPYRQHRTERRRVRRCLFRHLHLQIS